jgi:hypothetical protein
MLVGLGSYVAYRAVTRMCRAIDRRAEDAAVDLASEDSFPASDPPSAGR